ncbi:MAG: peptide chain release factor N(5)-glutamine methyltransferase [Hyphomicrobium sp.]
MSGDVPAAPSDGPILAASTIGDTQRRIRDILRARGFETPDVDARYLLQGILGLDAAALMLADLQPIGARASALNDALARRLGGEPVSRILGLRNFYGRTFRVTPDVLDPRPDTETLIDAVLARVRALRLADQPLRIADIGTGSGAIAVTLLAELPNATVVATDISRPALDVARDNARRLGVADRIDLVETRGLSGVAGRFDVVVSNPPYIPTGDVAALAIDVRGFDPSVALDGGPDGLNVYREIAIEISRLPPPLWICLEVGSGQHHDVVAIFAKALGVERMGTVDTFSDLGGHVRCVAIEIHS